MKFWICFKKFRVLVEKNSENRIKVFRSDRGGEFLSKNFISYCEEAGILRHFTAPYSPQQNGVVERRNRTVVAMTRSMLKEKQLPSTLWGEVVRHSVYLLNRVPTRALSGKTPYEAWKNKKPNLEHLRVFGCVAYMKIPSVHTKKLDDRSKAVVHLGREPGTKAYRLYDPENGTVHVSRDVYFEEMKEWSWKQQGEEPSWYGTFTITGTHSEENSGGNESYSLSNSNGGDTSENSETGSSSSSSSCSSEPKNYRSLNDIYDEIEEVEPGDELFFLGVEEPANYKQAIKEQEWEKAMKDEIAAI